MGEPGGSARLCRLFGFRSALPSRPHRSLVEAENAVVSQSMRHPDGWGVGWFVDDDAYVVKSATPAHACERFRRVSSRLTSHTFIVHVRRATVGAIDPMNAHPFRHGRWLFAHNGTVHGFDALRPWVEERTDPRLRAQILGETDSEHLFFFLLSSMAKAGVDPNGREPSEARAVAGALRQALAPLDAEARRRGVDRPSTNVMLTDGRSFIAHRAGIPMYMSTQKRFCADAPTCPEPNKVCLGGARAADQRVTHLLVASEPIGGDENVWEEIPDGGTVVLDAGFRLHVHAAPAGWESPPRPLPAVPPGEQPTLITARPRKTA
jgi:glutamine amidotransferase